MRRARVEAAADRYPEGFPVVGSGAGGVDALRDRLVKWCNECGKSDAILTERKANPRTETLVSAGGVAYRQVNGRTEVVLCGLIMTAATGRAGSQRRVKGHDAQGERVRWSLAKGTPDPGESLEETALREVREETGLEVEINSPLGSIEYWFSDYEADVRYHKTVHFYLMETVGGDTGLHDPEFDVVEWFPVDEALAVISYPNEAGILRRALETIGKPKGDG